MDGLARIRTGRGDDFKEHRGRNSFSAAEEGEMKMTLVAATKPGWKTVNERFGS
jgi:hypothetical protein